MDMDKIGTAAIMISIAFLLGAILLPIGLEEVYVANTTAWESSVVTIFQILFPILGVIGLSLMFLPRRLGRG